MGSRQERITRSRHDPDHKHIRANVIGYVALFLALSAGAYAAGLAPNSVDSTHIVNGEVRKRICGPKP